MAHRLADMRYDSPMRETLRHVKGRGGWAVLAFGLVLAPILYVLSIGPAYWLVWHGTISEETALTAYAPIEWVADRSTPIERLLTIYIRLWVPLPPNSQAPTWA
jgi:hypothetical protein